MADQRLILKHGKREIVLAKRVGVKWVSSQDVSNDLGAFIDAANEVSTGDRPVVELSYEEATWYCDPVFKISD